MTSTKTAPFTIDQLKVWVAEHRDDIERVKQARDHAAAERLRVDKYIEPIFNSYKFTRDDNGEPIEYSRDLYLTKDEAACTRFYAECDAAHREHGFTGPKDYCPALCAESDVIKAENNLLDYGCELIGFDGPIWNMEHREQFLDILLDAPAE